MGLNIVDINVFYSTFTNVFFNFCYILLTFLTFFIFLNVFLTSMIMFNCLMDRLTDWFVGVRRRLTQVRATSC